MQMQTFGIDNEVLNPVQGARALAMVAAGGRSGVATIRSLKVHQEASPTTSVAVDPGAAVVMLQDPHTDEAYTIRSATLAHLDIPASTTSLRRHLVAIMCEDPHVMGSPFAANHTTYGTLKVFSDVPEGTTSVEQLGLSYPGTALARIDVPPNISTIEDSHIVDCRNFLQEPRTKHEVFMSGMPMDADPDNGKEEYTSNTNGEPFFSMLQPQVTAPVWATHMSVQATLAQLGYRGGKTIATFAVAWGEEFDANRVRQFRSENTHAHAHGEDQRLCVIMNGKMDIPENLLGTTQRLQVEARKWAGHSAGEFVATAGTQLRFDVIWDEVAGGSL